MSNGADSDKVGTRSMTRAAGRQVPGDDTFTAIVPDYEVRNIILARGIDFHNEKAGEYAIPDYLVSKIGPDVIALADGTALYNNDRQHVTYVIEEVTTKGAFKAALQTPELCVVYCGHARFGQGMCFGDDTSPGEQWGSGTDDDDGLWRTGYPFIGLPLESDVFHHGFTINPVPGSDDKPDKNDCHPHVRGVFSSLRVFDLDQWDPQLVQFLPDDQDTDAGFWGYDARSEAGRFERHILANCGWTGTDTDPFDLGGTSMSCKVFCCIGCSTFIHNYKVVRFLDNWRRSGDDRYAYWTTAATFSSPMTAMWLHRLLSYPVRNDFDPWERCLHYAVRRANQDYIGLGAGANAQLI